MVYLTLEAKENAEALGIDQDAENKLYRTVRNLNKFFKECERGLIPAEIDIDEGEGIIKDTNGGNEYDEDDYER